MIRQRVALGLCVAAGFLGLMWLDTLLPGGPIFHLLIGLLMVGTLLEVYALMGRNHGEPMRMPALALVAALVAADYAMHVAGARWHWCPLKPDAAPLCSFYALAGVGAVAGVWVLALAHLLARPPQRWLAGAPAAVCGFLYVWLNGAHLFPLRALGIGYVFALLAAAKLGDAGAFFAGRRWGRHKLAPRASPNKTIEGAAAGLLASVAGACAMALIFALRGQPGFWALFGLAVGLAGQVGDLVASAIKRSAGAKDSGTLLPAFGGLLDVVDSPLMAAPVALWLVAW